MYFDLNYLQITTSAAEPLANLTAMTAARQDATVCRRVLSFSDFAGNSSYSPNTYQNLSIGQTWIINRSLVNDARAGWLRQRTDTYIDSYGKNWGQTLGIPNISPELMPAFNVYGLTVSGPQRRIYETLSFRDDLSKLSGSHAFKMGYEVLDNRLNSALTAGFLLGAVSQAQYTRQQATWLPLLDPHFQDDWKVTPNLALNLGIRYSIESGYKTRWNQTSNFDPNAIDSVSGLRGAIVHPTSTLNQTDKNNFQPRFGVAWHPLKKTVFRGGLALYTVDVKFSSLRDQFDEYSAVVNDQQAPGDPRPIYQISQIPKAAAFSTRPDGTSPYVGANFGSRTVAWWDPNLRNPYSLNWNLSIQHQLTPTYLLEMMYQGSAGVGLIERWQANTFPIDFGADNPALRAAAFARPQNYRPYPQFGDILFRSNTGHSTFHSGSVKLEKRYSAGMTFTTFYTFSKAIDSQDDDNFGSGVAPIQNRGLEKGPAGFNRSHMWVGAVTWALPVGKGRRFLSGGGILDKLLGGWEIVYIQSLESGNPLVFGFANSKRTRSSAARRGASRCSITSTTAAASNPSSRLSR